MIRPLPSAADNIIIEITAVTGPLSPWPEGSDKWIELESVGLSDREVDGTTLNH